MCSSSQPKFLLADNVADYRKSLIPLLKLEGYNVEEAESVQQAIEALSRHKPDLALIDLRLTNDNDSSDMSGLEVAKKAQEMDVPCILITAFPSVEAARLALRTRGTEPLAVDFVSKAEGPQALLDAIRVVLEKHKPPNNDELILNAQQRVARKGQAIIPLSDKQYKLLELLASQPEKVFSAAEIMKAVYGERLTESEARMEKKLERLVERTREKIERDAKNPKHLLNVWGRGYRLVLKPE